MTLGSHQYLARKVNTQLKERICLFQKGKKITPGRTPTHVYNVSIDIGVILVIAV